MLSSDMQLSAVLQGHSHSHTHKPLPIAYRTWLLSGSVFVPNHLHDQPAATSPIADTP